MKSFIFLFFCSALAITPKNVLSQNAKIVIDTDKLVTVNEVFKIISNQTDYSFIYQENLFSNLPKVQLKKGVIRANKLLELSFPNDNVVYEFTNKNTIIIKENTEPVVPVLEIEQKEISGTITDIDGMPLPGASVIVKGTNIGATTDFDGNFSLSVPDDATTLSVSFLGYASLEIEINGQSIINIQMTPTESALDEVVIVGYGSTKSKNVSGAIEQVNVTDIGDRPGGNIATSLQGLMPGVTVQFNNGDPRAGADINIRGFNSINGGSALVLVDGIQGDLNILNPEDIKSITILKDAASAAIYGARGAFGVVLVTTKKGREGDIKIDISSNIGFTTPAARTDYISDPVLYGKTVDAALFGYNGSNLTGYTNDEDWNRLQQVADGVVAPWRELQANGTYKFYDSTDWYDYLYKDVTTSNTYNFSVSGGTEKIKAYLSGRSYKTGTIQNIVDEDVKRNNIKSNISFQVNDWLEISDNIQYNSGDQIEYGGKRDGWGTSWIYSNNYLYAHHPTEIDGIPYDFQGQSTHASLEEGKNYNSYEYKEFINTIRAKITPFDGMVINVDYSNRFTNSDTRTRLNEFQYLTGTKLSLQTVGLNRLTERNSKKEFNAFNFFATFNKTFADDHNFKLLGGFNQEDYFNSVVIAEQGGLLDPSYSNLNLGTEVLTADGSTQSWAVQGYFGRLNYNFKDKYLLEVIARYDGSSRFPEESRWGFFPTASVGWTVSRENFWEPIQDVVNSFKLRSSYGQLGNQNVGLHTFSQLLPIGRSDWLTDGSQLNYVGVPNPLPANITWETTTTTNLGFDLGFINNKLTASADLYKKNITDMYLPGERLPGVFGASSPKENIAGLEVKGFEVSLAYKNSFDLGGSPLNFNASFSVSNNEAIITKYPNVDGLLSDFYEGQKLGEIWGYRVDGQFQSDAEASAYQNLFNNPSSDLGQVYGFAINVAQNNDWKGLKAGDLKYLDLNGDGEISKGNNTLEDHGDLEVIGNALPKLPFGFSLSADWKGFDFFMAAAGVVSQDWYPRGRLYWGTYERPYIAFIRKDLVSNAWSTENPGGIYPQTERAYTALGSNRQLSVVNDHLLTNIGYLRIKNLSIGYTIPQELTKKVQIDGVRFFLSAENIFTMRFGGLTKYIDPEQAGSGASLNDPNGATNRSRVEDYPMGKIYSFGVKISL